MQVMGGLSALWTSLRSLVRWFDKDDDAYVAIAVEPAAAAARRQPALRDWTASAASPEEAFQLGCEAVRLFARAPAQWNARSINEATTRSLLIDPLLRRLGWSPWLCEVPLKEGGRPDYFKSDEPSGGRAGVAIEAKAATPLHDNIDGRGERPAYANHAQQLVSYLDGDGIRAAIFTNARFWWRVERDAETGRLYALRFDLNLAQDLLKDHGRSEALRLFAGLFHADAFRVGANMTLSAHPGRSLDYGPVGRIHVKDLNKGLHAQPSDG